MRPAPHGLPQSHRLPLSAASARPALLEEQRFREIFVRLHAGHANCRDDEWLDSPCLTPAGRPVDRPIVWSRRNGPWRRSEILWVGAAPGNDGGRGHGDLGAHGTRIPFGGDVAGANLDALLGSIGLDRNRTFIVAALNRLPSAGGGEPKPAELRSPAGDFADSIEVLRATLVAVSPRLIVALGNVALRALMAAWAARAAGSVLPGLGALRSVGFERNESILLQSVSPAEPQLEMAWRAAWDESPRPALVWISHPSAQNMSPWAGTGTGFYRRMIEARDALRRATARWLGWTVPEPRPLPPSDGIYALREWRDRIAARHAELDRLWRMKGV
jgi:uracil-DNA glycosylase family 4